MKSVISSLHRCQLCPSVFFTIEDYQTHMAKANHNRTKLVCLWCYSVEKTFQRPHDLGTHVRKYHQEAHDSLPKNFFSTGNCFYLSLCPGDYRRQHTPAVWDDESSKRARQYIEEWTGQQTCNPSRTLDDWKSGWESAHFTPPLDDHQEVDYEDSASEHERPSTLELTSLCLSTEDADATFKTADGEFVKVKIIPQIFTNIKAVTSLTRKMAILKESFPTPAPDGHWEFCSSPKLHLDAAEELGIESSFITAAFKCNIFKRRRTAEPTELPPLDTVVEDLINSELAATTTSDLTAVDEFVHAASDTTAPTDLYSPTAHQDYNELDSIQVRAKAILELGGMPLVAPGRRAWDEDEQVELQDGGLLWPPQGWKDMTNDDKLQATEFAALTCLQPSPQRFRPRARECLLDECNFLVLPGTTLPQTTANTKMRFYNGEILRRIANNEASGSTENSAIVAMLYRATHIRDRTLDIISSRISKAGVPLKL